MQRPFRIAIIGAGQVTANCHLPAALSSSQIKVTALVDTVVERACKLLDRFNIRAHVFQDTEEVFDLVDGIVIATPNNSHCEIALKCVEKGVPLLIEKPLAGTLADAEKICKASSLHRIPVAIGYCRRFWPNVRLMRDLIKSKFFGNVKRFVFQSGNVGGWSSMSGFHLNRDMSGGGVLMTVGTHFLDLMLNWFGYPIEFHLADDSLGGPEANAVCTFQFMSDKRSFEGTIRLSKTVNLPSGFVMETDEGLIVLREGENASILYRPEQRPDVESVIRRRGYAESSSSPGGFVLQLEEFAQSFFEGREPAIPCRDGLTNLKLISSLYRCRSKLSRDWYDYKTGSKLL